MTLIIMLDVKGVVACQSTKGGWFSAGSWLMRNIDKCTECSPAGEENAPTQRSMLVFT